LTPLSGAAPISTSEAVDERHLERHLRNAAIIDQGRINAHRAAIIGVGAIGSHLAEILAKLGVGRLTLIDPDEVDTVNLGVQGFYESEVGRPKTEAVAGRLRCINGLIQVEQRRAEYEPGLIEPGSVVFSCVDSIKVRRSIFRDFRENDWPVFLDGRMSAESLQVFCIDRSGAAADLYRRALFPSREAHRESCSARATIYCATLAAAILCTQFKKWAMDQTPEPRLCFDLIAMDCFR
jgi:molybdopterin/thiamine biosynthesis adenylyltransferase